MWSWKLAKARLKNLADLMEVAHVGLQGMSDVFKEIGAGRIVLR